jgi:hypothetical protein
MTTAWPLHWPTGFARTTTPRTSKFSTSISASVNNVLDELRRFGKDSGRPVQNVVISSNVTLAEQRPKDGGVAVYFRWDSVDCCIAVDRYVKPEENLQAISRVIEAERTKLRHGGLNIVRAAMRGYAALPPPKDPSGQLAPPWWKVLGFESGGVTLDAAEARYRELVKAHHPDRGGDAARFNLITDAIARARVELFRG